MSAETDFRALLAAHAPLTALVGSRIALNALAQGEALPYVVFTASHTPTLLLNGTQAEDQVALTVQCWGATALQADAVADAVAAAVAAAPAARCAAVLERTGGYDPELGLDATVLTVEWWA